ncbi:hypothetical protein M3650_16715 [Paenibacillus sp. MER TA 81-3]|uniref:hypothetical protein n=1 Tax=Paenibacillus sp. MER TA 81-3 TaxID=2939573 RepID=UPI002042549D|nr:hypothetical protein [Paenibacillus sp. MER TA 81-3]MCM3340241.1 hypothetical protein [Paenibacillus sp. MER TA 81-3]
MAPRWLLYVLVLFVGIGIFSSFRQDPLYVLIPIVLIAVIWLLYRFGPKRNTPRVKKSAQTEAKLKGTQPKKRVRSRSRASLRVIDGQKSKETKKQSK